MNQRQKLVQKQFLNNEQAVIKRLEQVYGVALKDINSKIKNLQFNIDNLQLEYDWMDDGDPKKAQVKSMIQSKIYQKKYQESLQGQIEGILNQMQTKQYLTVSDYLSGCYEDGFIGSLFDLHGQGVPLAIPMDQTKMVRAVQLDSKISQGLYSRLGEDVDLLKKKITAQVSRSISNGTSFAQTAKQLAGYTRIGYNKAVRIARTEGHRIQCTAADNVAHEARERGADVAKQWDATLDGLTRESHRMVDGEIRELDEPFSNGLMFPSDPSGGAAEVVNCRCAYLQRARWALEGEFTKWNSFTGQLETFESPESYGEFKKSFWSDENVRYMKYVQEKQDKYGTKDMRELLDQMSDREYTHYSKLLSGNPLFNTKVAESQYGVKYGNDAIDVDFEYIRSKAYSEKFSVLTDDQIVNDAVCGTARKILDHCTGTSHEDMYLINANDGTIFAQVTDTAKKSGIIYSDEFINKIVESKEKGIPIIGIHNHPQGTPPSPDDFRKAYDNGYSFGVVVGNNGQVYRYETPKEEISKDLAQAMDRDIGIFLAGGMDVDRSFEMVYNPSGLKYTIIERGGE